MKLKRCIALTAALLMLFPVCFSACTGGEPQDSLSDPGTVPGTDETTAPKESTPPATDAPKTEMSESTDAQPPSSGTEAPVTSRQPETATPGATDPFPKTTEPSVTTPEETYDPALDDSSIPAYPAGSALTERPAGSGSWVGTDGLGRVLPTYEETGGVRAGKFVGIFYWSWHGEFADNKTGQGNQAAYNIQKILDAHPNIRINDPSDPLWRPEGLGRFYFWNEPIYGYYNNATDKWVVRRQAELLADAGVDVIFFDNTNGRFLWLDAVRNIAEVFFEARQDGVRTPQLSFILPFAPNDDVTYQLTQLYSQLYQDPKYADLWFRWGNENKPLIMAYSSQLNQGNATEKALLNYFEFRAPYAGLKGGAAQKAWGWLSLYPQTVYPNMSEKEQISVGIAQNWSTKYDNLSAMNGDGIMGRSYTSKGYDTRPDSKLYGANFAEQFEYALKVDPQFIFITGWNEWVAIRQQGPWPADGNGVWPSAVYNAFADQFCDEYSRDIEPSKGDLKDHYYYQMVSYIRRFKGTEPVPESSGRKTINIEKGFGQWANVSPTYVAYEGNTIHRNALGYIDPDTGSRYVYTDATGRNDIYDAKVTHDDTYVYFMVRTVKDITPYNGGNWMNLYLDTDPSPSSKNWETFEFVLNRQTPTATKAKLERSKGSWNWEVVGEVDYTVQGNVMMVKIPKAMLGISGNTFTINFKWTDNVKFTTPGDIMDFYTSGDVAPGGRFKYQYNAKP